MECNDLQYRTILVTDMDNQGRFYNFALFACVCTSSWCKGWRTMHLHISQVKPWWHDRAKRWNSQNSLLWLWLSWSTFIQLMRKSLVLLSKLITNLSLLIVKSAPLPSVENARISSETLVVDLLDYVVQDLADWTNNVLGTVPIGKIATKNVFIVKNKCSTCCWSNWSYFSNYFLSK